MIPFSTSPAPQAGDQHVLDALTTLFTGAHDPSDAERTLLSDHLVTCASCRATLALLLAATSRRDDLQPDEQAVFATLYNQVMPLVHGPDHADPETLAAYAERRQSLGDTAARQRFPFFALHLDQCADCRSTLADLADLFQRAHTAGLIPSGDPTRAAAVAPAQAPRPATPPADATEDDTLWILAEPGALRLREPLIVVVGPGAVAIVSALPHLHAAAPARSATLDARDDAIGRQERLLFTVPGARPDPQSAPAWLRLTLDLRARLDRTLRVTLHGESFAANQTDPNAAPDVDAVGAPMPGLAWIIELLDGPIRRLVGRGATDADGVATFTMPDAGHYELTLSSGAQSWQIPLDTHLDTAPTSPSA